MAGAVGSAALRSHHGASLEDRGPHRAIAGRQEAGPIRRQHTGPDLSPHGSSRPKPLRRPRRASAPTLMKGRNRTMSDREARKAQANARDGRTAARAV